MLQKILFSLEVSVLLPSKRVIQPKTIILDKHGQLGIWDARAPADEVADEDEDVTTPEDSEGGKYWRLQLHWPATSKSSISTVKFDPIDSHNVCPNI